MYCYALSQKMRLGSQILCLVDVFCLRGKQSKHWMIKCKNPLEDIKKLCMYIYIYMFEAKSARNP